MATETLIIATPAKLQDGSWGVRFTVDVRLSKDILAGWASEWSTNPWVVRVQTKAGKQWEARVSGILSCRKDKADKNS